MKSRGEKAIELIKTINWQVGFDFHRQGSALALAREYLRRISLWIQEIGHAKRWPFFSVVEEVAPGFKDAGCTNFVAQLPIRTELTRKLTEWYLLWNLWADQNATDRRVIELPAPYDPIPLLFRRGYLYLRPENKQLFVGTSGISLRSWDSHCAVIPVTCLDEDSLAKLDESFEDENR